MCSTTSKGIEYVSTRKVEKNAMSADIVVTFFFEALDPLLSHTAISLLLGCFLYFVNKETKCEKKLEHGNPVNFCIFELKISSNHTFFFLVGGWRVGVIENGPFSCLAD